MIEKTSLISPNVKEVDLVQNNKNISPSIGDFFEKSLDQLNKNMHKSNTMSDEHIIQGKHSLHEVLIELEKTNLEFRYMTQIRNKVLDAYNEVMRMQV